MTVDESGALVTKDDYYPFGLQMDGYSHASGNPYNKLKYSGKELDEENGLYKYHFGWRDYYPELGRWVVVDPARQFASGYVFNGNTAVNGYDADGRWFGIDDFIVAGVSFVTGYVSHGLSTGNWGADAMVTGVIAAATSELAMYTGGMAAGFMGLAEGSAGFAITSATVGGTIGGAASSAANQLYSTGSINMDLVGRSALSGFAGGLAGGFSGQYLTSDPVLTSIIGGAVGGGVDGSFTGNALQGAILGAYAGAWSGSMTYAGYQQYGEYLTNKYLEEDAFGKDINRKSLTSDNPTEYNCKDFLVDMRANGLSKEIRSVSFGDNQIHVGFDLGRDMYGHHYILSKQGANFPIMVNTARSLSNGAWLKSGFYYKGKYFNVHSGRYGQWRYLKF